MPRMMRGGHAWRSLLVAWLLLGVTWPAAGEIGQAPGAAAMPRKMRVVLVPLDDRPVCVQYPQMMAALAHAEVIVPPLALLGRFTVPGDTDALAAWLATQDWPTVDALIVSMDMLAYGGLVASRIHGVDEATALRRLEVLRAVHAASPALPVYAFSVMMRLAPTADGANEAYREKLARWAELARGRRTSAEARELADLVRDIPPAALDDYTRARRRNRAVNVASVALVQDNVVRYLVVAQDDARPRGVHLADRAAVTDRMRQAGVTARVGIQPGADEVAMILLARAVLEHHGISPTVRPTYSTARARAMVAPFEDRPLHETVSFQVRASGAVELRRGHTPADLDLFVFASRHEPGLPAHFARRIHALVERGARAIVADIDPRGDVQGGSPAFTEALLEAGVFRTLYGYASWNTAGNTIGTAIPHGLLVYAGAVLASRCTSPAWADLADAQVTFLLHRLLNDYAYQGVVRPALNEDLRRAGRTSAWMAAHAAEVADRVRAALERRLQEYARPFMAHVYTLPSPAPGHVAVQVFAPSHLEVRLPWARTFEAAIAFEVPVAAVPRPVPQLPACTAAVL